MLIVADDLSGAADCSVGCAVSGLRTLVLLDRNAASLNADVVTVDTDSRCLNPAMAEAITEATIREHLKGPQQFLYKKVDSTLRGNIGAELSAALREFRRLCGVESSEQGIVILAPAFPKNGRTTIAGRQFVNGVPLEHTEIGKREAYPVRVYLPDLLRESGIRAQVVSLDVVRSGPEALWSRMNGARSDIDVLVCDAETDEDLYSIAIASVSLHPGVMWSGSAGLAHQLLRVARMHRADPGVESVRIACGPTLIVVGSLSNASREQVQALSSDVSRLCVTPDLLRAGSQSPAWNMLSSEICDAVKGGSDTVVYLDHESHVDLSQGRALSSALARLLLPCANEIGALIVTGGETARAVLSAFGVNRLRLLGELEPGLPLSITEGWHRNLLVLTKAGDFGNRQSLLHCREYFQNLDRSRSLQFADELIRL